MAPPPDEEPCADRDAAVHVGAGTDVEDPADDVVPLEDETMLEPAVIPLLSWDVALVAEEEDPVSNEDDPASDEESGPEDVVPPLLAAPPWRGSRPGCQKPITGHVIRLSNTVWSPVSVMARAMAAVSLGSYVSSTHGPPALLVAPTENEDPPADEDTTARLLDGTIPPELEELVLFPPLVLHAINTPAHTTPAARLHAPPPDPCIISVGSRAWGWLHQPEA